MPVFVPVIIAGGSGSRLWPCSRQLLPKPFVQLPGRERALIDEVYARLNGEPLPSAAAVVSVTAADYAFLCRHHYAAVSGAAAPPHSVIAEPLAKNTAPAIAVATELICRRFGEEAVIAVFPADHAISPAAAYRGVLARALTAAADGYMALLGVAPTYPATGFGYIECGDMLAEEVYAVQRFVEKPEKAAAAEFIERGGFLWNGGTFCFRAGTGKAEIARHAPDIARAAAAVCDTSDAGDMILPSSRQYEDFPAISFDYAVMEKTTAAAVVRASGYSWDDVGSWSALAGTLPADERGNRISGDAVLEGSERCFVAAQGGRLVSILGLSDVYVIDTADALLVTAADQAENVRTVYESLHRTGRSEAVQPATVYRPWGSYTVLSEGTHYKVKRIDVLPGQKLSLQSHRHRSEHWTCISGDMGVVVAERDLTLSPDESCHIPLGAKHRMYNAGAEPAAVIEVQIGDYLGEDDITRYDDIYGRL